jgi:hypothetical protein
MAQGQQHSIEYRGKLYLFSQDFVEPEEIVWKKMWMAVRELHATATPLNCAEALARASKKVYEEMKGCKY